MFIGLIFFGLALINFSRRPYLASRWIVLFSYIWIYFPAVLYIAGDEEKLSYSLSLFSRAGLSFRAEHLYPLVVVIILVTIAQAVLKTKPPASMPNVITIRSQRSHVEGWWLLLCTILWLIVVGFFLGELSFSKISQLFIPAYFDESKFKNYFLRLIFLYVPLGVFGVLITKNGLTWSSVGALFVSLAASLGSGQRRDAITVLIFCIALFYFGKRQIFLHPRKIKVRTIFLLVAGGALLSPVLWGARVLFTNYLETGKWINPFEYRSFVDVVLGSGATGPFAYLTVMEYVERHGVNWGYSLYYGLTQFIPRSLWEGKPMDIDSQVEGEFFLLANPSAFWMGDLYFSFGLFWWIAFLFISFLLDKIQVRAMRNRSMIYALLNISMLANSFALFKNGLGTYIVAVLSMFLGLIFCFFPRILKISISKST